MCIRDRYNNVILTDTELSGLKTELPDKWEYYIAVSYTHLETSDMELVTTRKEADPMKQGALIFDEQTDRYDIRFDLADYYGCLLYTSPKDTT